MKERKQLFASVNAINFRMYNEVSSKSLPAVILFIDNGDVVKEVDSELEDFLTKLTRDGAGVGIYTVLAASRVNAVRYALVSNFKNKLAMFMIEAGDIASVVGRSSYTLPEIRGRALIKLKDVHVAQCYLPVPFEDEVSYSKLIGEMIADIADNNTAKKAVGVRIVPEVVYYEDIAEYAKLEDRLTVLGFNTENTEPAYLDFSITNQLVVGASLTGKTNILKLILTQFNLYTESKIFIADSKSGDLQDYEYYNHIIYMDTESQLDNFYEKLSGEIDNRQKAFESSGLRLRDFCASYFQALVLIDDGDNFIELCKKRMAEVEKLIPKAMELGIVFIVTTLPTKMRGYDNLSKMLKSDQSGIVLGNPNEQNLLPVQAPRGYKPAPDIGFIFKRGDTHQVKLPFIAIEDMNVKIQKIA